MSAEGRRHQEETRIVLRPIGSGLPLGFYSFATGCCCSPVRRRLDPRRAAGIPPTPASGWVALALCALALYGGTALALEDARRREWLPLFRRGGARRAFEGYEEQIRRPESEPGVRQQL